MIEIQNEVYAKEKEIYENIKKYQKLNEVDNVKVNSNNSSKIIKIDDLLKMSNKELGNLLLEHLSETEKKNMLKLKIMENIKNDIQQKMGKTKKKWFNLSINDLSQNNKIMNVEEFCKAVDYILDFYEAKKLTQIIEDDKWILHNSNSNKYKLNTTEILYENSVSLAHICNPLLFEYLTNITTILTNICDNVVVKYKLIETNNDGIALILIICKIFGSK